MPAPFTVEDEATGQPLATFDLAGNLILAGALLLGGAGSPDGPLIPPDVPEITSGQFLCPPASYAPASATLLGVAGTTYAAFSSDNVNTGPFTAPPSGKALVTASFTGALLTGTTGIGAALAQHGTVTPLAASTVQFGVTALAIYQPYQIEFLVTGLAPGSPVNLDLLGATGSASDTFNIQALAQTSATLTAAARGAPVIMTVQGV